MSTARLQAGKTRILYKPERLSTISLEWLQPEFWRLRGLIEAELGGRGQALAVRTETGPAVLRRFRRGGWMARITRDRYLYTGFDRSRALREFCLLDQLCGLGLPVPEPWAASCERAGSSYRAGIMTARIPGAATLADCAETLNRPDWDRLFETLDRFFEAGLLHPDLNAHNILLSESTRWFVIDFDRARLARGPVSPRPMLERLSRSLDKLAVQARPDWL